MNEPRCFQYLGATLFSTENAAGTNSLCTRSISGLCTAGTRVRGARLVSAFQPFLSRGLPYSSKRYFVYQPYAVNPFRTPIPFWGPPVLHCPRKKADIAKSPDNKANGSTPAAVFFLTTFRFSALARPFLASKNLADRI